MVQRLIRDPPPSPPQSNDGDLPSDSSQAGDLYPMYGSPALPAYEGSGQSSNPSLDEQSSLAINLHYVPTSDYPQNVSSQHQQALTNDIRVNTPPAEDGVASSSLESTNATRWSSPSRKQTLSRPRVQRSPRQRRRVRNRNDSDAGFVLSAPLSVLTREMTHIPIKDMEKHVNRPTEERRAEALQKQGKIARPMNSFMLYRSAYAERTKELFRQQNHQVVSTAAGQSWNQEEPEIKQKYEHYARIEKQNHLKAHPGYKFTPAKDKKKRALDDDHSFLGYRSTPEGSPAQRHVGRLSTFSSPEVGSSAWDSGHPTPPDMVDHGLPTDGYFPSSWPTSHPVRPPSGMMLTSDPSQYIQPSSHHDEIQYASSTTLAGLPGAAHHDLLQPQSQISTSGSGPGGQLDPQLLDFSGSSLNSEGGSHVYGNSQYPLWQESAGNIYLAYSASLEPSPIPYAGSTSLPQALDGREAWDSSQASGLDPDGGEFDRWINNPQGY